MATVRSLSELVFSEAPADKGDQARQPLRAVGRKIVLHAARDHLVHHQAMAEAGVGRAQDLLAQEAEARMQDGESCVVADGADVAAMIGEALELAGERAQPDGARRNLPAKRRLDRAGEGERVGDRAVARDAAGEQRGALERRAGHERVDPLVHVAEPLLEADHRLAVGGEAEMARLDDAGVHRADRDLVQAFALSRQEDVGLAMAQPCSRVGQSFRLQAGEIAHRALQPDRRRMHAADRWQAVVGARQVQQAPLAGARLDQRHVREARLAP